MADRSIVTSVEAIESFRADVIVFLSKARPTVEEVSNELLRLRVWLEHDQRDFWAREIRSLGLQLEEAQQELFSARLSKLQSASVVQELAVQRLKHKLREAEERQQTTRKWSRELENRSDPLVKEVQNLHTFLTIDMVRAVTYLEQVVNSLEAYADVAPASPGAGSGAEHNQQAHSASAGPDDGTAPTGEQP